MSLITTLIEKGFEPITPKTTLPAIFRKVYAPTFSVIVIVEVNGGRHEVWVRNGSSEMGVGDISYDEMTEQNVLEWLNVVEQAYLAGNLYGSTAQSISGKPAVGPEPIPTSESVWRRISECPPPAFVSVLVSHSQCIATGYRSGTGEYYYGEGTGKILPTPTHWMPLPEPPKD